MPEITGLQGSRKGDKKMLDAKVKELLNEQVNKEFYSAYLYLDFANFYNRRGLDGFYNWFYIQTQEERDHAMLFMKYLQNNSADVELLMIPKPEISLERLEDPLHEAVKHEAYVTSLINNLYDAAQSAKDFRTVQFLDWFVKEQGEEEKNTQDLVTKMELFGSEPRSLYMLDNELKARVYTAPSLVL